MTHVRGCVGAWGVGAWVRWCVGAWVRGWGGTQVVAKQSPLRNEVARRNARRRNRHRVDRVSDKWRGCSEVLCGAVRATAKAPARSGLLRSHCINEFYVIHGLDMVGAQGLRQSHRKLMFALRGTRTHPQSSAGV